MTWGFYNLWSLKSLPSHCSHAFFASLFIIAQLNNRPCFMNLKARHIVLSKRRQIISYLKVCPNFTHQQLHKDIWAVHDILEPLHPAYIIRNQSEILTLKSWQCHGSVVKKMCLTFAELQKSFNILSRFKVTIKSRKTDNFRVSYMKTHRK